MSLLGLPRGGRQKAGNWDRVFNLVDTDSCRYLEIMVRCVDQKMEHIGDRVHTSMLPALLGNPAGRGLGLGYLI